MFQRKLKVGYFVLEWLNICATAFYGNYIFFFLRSEFAFGNRDNLLYAALGGFLYVFVAWFAGKFAQKRGYFTALLIGFAIMALVLVAGVKVSTAAGQLAILLGWTFGMCFTWPTLEGLVSEGEDRKGLAAMVGIYNIVWASGAALAYFSGGALMEALGKHSVFWLSAAIHAVQFAITLWLQKQARALGLAAHAPAQTGDIDPHDLHVPRERKRIFLRLAWLSNPFAYIAMNTVLPLIPDLANRLQLTTKLAGFVCSVWMFGRLFAFVVLWRWAGWHYRFGWLVGAYATMVGCFVALLLIENLAVVVLAQLAFGLAVGLIYYSSLFYAMDVGETKGEHGGFHEALIGVGLCGGPAIGTIALRVFPGIPHVGILGVSACLLAGLLIILWAGGKLARKSLG
jgi:predicted MFS family arabinose efflux permease